MRGRWGPVRGRGPSGGDPSGGSLIATARKGESAKRKETPARSISLPFRVFALSRCRDGEIGEDIARLRPEAPYLHGPPRGDMAHAAPTSLVRQLGSLFEGGSAAGLSDRQLLERFNAPGQPADESAFAAIVAR